VDYVLTSLLHPSRNYFNVFQITNLIYRSIEHILWITGDKQRMPYLSLSLVCDQTLSLVPSRRTIYSAFHSMVDQMAGIAQNLTPLETWIKGVPVPDGFITVCFSPYVFNLVRVEPSRYFVVVVEGQGGILP